MENEMNGFGEVGVGADTEPPSSGEGNVLLSLAALEAEYQGHRAELVDSHLQAMSDLQATYDERRETLKAQAVDELRAIEESAKESAERAAGLRKLLKLSGKSGAKGPAKARSSSRPPRVEDGLAPRDRIAAFLEHNEASRLGAISEGTGIDSKTCARELKSMVEEKIAKQKGKARGTTYELAVRS